MTALKIRVGNIDYWLSQFYSKKLALSCAIFGPTGNQTSKTIIYLHSNFMTKLKSMAANWLFFMVKTVYRTWQTAAYGQLIAYITLSRDKRRMMCNQVTAVH